MKKKNSPALSRIEGFPRLLVQLQYNPYDEELKKTVREVILRCETTRKILFGYCFVMSVIVLSGTLFYFKIDVGDWTCGVLLFLVAFLFFYSLSFVAQVFFISLGLFPNIFAVPSEATCKELKQALEWAEKISDPQQDL